MRRCRGAGRVKNLKRSLKFILGVSKNERRAVGIFEGLLEAIFGCKMRTGAVKDRYRARGPQSEVPK